MNRIILIGNLTRDPESGITSNDIQFAKMTLAVNRKFGKGVDFINCTAWRATAENCIKYLSKGKKVAVVGSLQINSYEASDGSKRYITDIQIEEVEFLSQRENNTEQVKVKLDDKDEHKYSAIDLQQKFMAEDDDELPF